MRRILRAPTNLQLVVSLEALRRNGRRRRRRACREEAGLSSDGAGHHLAPLREADDEIIDIETLVVIILTTFRVVEVTSGVGVSDNVVRQRAENDFVADSQRHRR